MPQEILFENESLFLNMVELEGPEKALEYYAGFRKANKTGQLFSENSMNTLGYSFLSKKDYLTAIRLFEANVESYPGSWNVYDSLGEACLAAGDRTKARENYRKSVELNPQNENGKKILAEMD